MTRCMESDWKMYKVLVTGAAGQLGQDMMAELKKRGYTAIGVDVDEMDITDEEKVMEVISGIRPQVVIHCAAFTAVDAAQDQEALCRQINAKGTDYVAKACEAVSCKMIYLSTDYVFEGTGERPWEPEDEVKKPLNVYGQTKYEGEQAVRNRTSRYFIVRTAWVFGPHGKNFVRTMLNLAKKYDRITVVNDQFGTPTYTPDLAVLLADLMETEKYGIYHATNEGDYISWYEFACEIFKLAGKEISVVPVSSEEYAAKAKRPKNSRLSKKKIRENGLKPLPQWKDALQRFLDTFNEEE